MIVFWFIYRICEVKSEVTSASAKSASASRSGAVGILLAALCVAIILSGAVELRGDTTASGDSEAQAAKASEKADASQEHEIQADSVVVLSSGHRLEGTIVKRTHQAVFLDIGFTILSLPFAEIREIQESGGTSDGTSGRANARESRERGEREIESESIFFGAKLGRGTVEQKAREVSESVVRVLCLGKSGSGFIINGDEGYVVTNFHVIEGEQDISVVLYVPDDSSSDGAPGDSFPVDPARVHSGVARGGEPAGGSAPPGSRRGVRKLKLEQVRIVAMNPFFDLALLKIEDSAGVRLKTSYLGEFARVSAGDPVFAIGSPLGLERTVTEGIVSNRNRARGGQLLIQTTAPINPGNSGGPLFNDRGEVIGVTSLKIVGSDSLGFAIPIHYVKDFLRNRDSFAFDKDHPNTGVRYLAPPPKRAAAPRDPSVEPSGGDPSVGTPSLSGVPAGRAPKTSQRPEPREGGL